MFVCSLRRWKRSTTSQWRRYWNSRKNWARFWRQIASSRKTFTEKNYYGRDSTIWWRNWKEKSACFAESDPWRRMRRPPTWLPNHPTPTRYPSTLPKDTKSSNLIASSRPRSAKSKFSVTRRYLCADSSALMYLLCWLYLSRALTKCHRLQELCRPANKFKSIFYFNFQGKDA